MATGNPAQLSLRNDVLEFAFPDVSPDAQLRIDFHRTLRIPDDGKDYPLPAGLGAFPLDVVQDYPLPDAWRRRGGVFLPMYGSEALWMQFHGDFPMAIKVAAGKINAVSGKPWSEPLNGEEQDYVVAGTQPWLDGFNAGEGHVRQFVSRPLGEGASVEEQLTGEATWGGLQILVYPLKRERWDAWQEKQRLSRNRYSEIGVSACEPHFQRRSSTSEATAMGLGMGGRIRQVIEKDPWGIDAWDTTRQLRVFVHLLHALDYARFTGRPAPETPVTAKVYAEQGMPWFDWDSGQAGLAPAATFQGIEPVAQVLAQRGVTQMGDDGMPVSDVVQLRGRLREGEW